MRTLPLPHLFGATAALVGVAGMLAWRTRETRRALTASRILAPPLGMSTGLVMFVLPAFRIPTAWAAGAFLFGALVLAYPLQHTSTLALRDDEVVLQRSRAFFAILLGLVVVRLALRGYLGQLVSPEQTAGIFFLIAFGAVLRWRAGMYRAYRSLRARPT